MVVDDSHVVEHHIAVVGDHAGEVDGRACSGGISAHFVDGYARDETGQRTTRGIGSRSVANVMVEAARPRGCYGKQCRGDVSTVDYIC